MKILKSSLSKCFLLGFAVMAFSSCSKDSELNDSAQSDSYKKEIKIAVANDLGFKAGSRAAVSDLTSFFASKEIYMYVDKITDSGTEELYGKQVLTVVDGVLTFPQTLYYPEDGSPVNIYVVATTPYGWGFKDTTTRPSSFGHYIRDNQWNSNSDLLYAKVENVASGTNPVSLTFKHLCSLISVAVVTPDNSKLTGINIINTKNQATYNMLTGEYSSLGGEIKGIIAPTKKSTDFEDGISYSNSYIAPQTLEGGTQFIMFDYDGKDYFYELSSQMIFKPGYQYKFHITLKENAGGGTEVEETDVQVASTISDWVPETKSATISFE